MSLLGSAELFGIGLAAGVLGTIVGLGGGFIVIPTLRLAFGMAPAVTAGVSLVMVLANGISGSLVYWRQHRADVRLALLVAATGIPTSVLGAYFVARTSYASFDLLYGALLIYFFFDIMRRRNAPKRVQPLNVPGLRRRVLVDSEGTEFEYQWSAPIALLCGVVVGFTSSFFGIGGGVVFVMVFIAMFAMPPHVVTATSTLAIVLTAPVGVAAHAYAHDIDWSFALPLALGGLSGGQIGPHIARRMSSPVLLTVLAFALLAAAIALMIKHIFPGA